MCECIKNIDADLKLAGQATTMLIRTDKWKHENRYATQDEHF